MSWFRELLAVEKVRVLPNPHWELTRDLVYESDLLGDIIVVPKGFRTDFASIPHTPLAWYLFAGKADEAATVHDLLYSTQIYPREKCDAIFHEAIKILGYSEATARVMYCGVRLGGWRNWNDDNIPQHLEIAQKLNLKCPTIP